jgi:hypothetical protein
MITSFIIHDPDDVCCTRGSHEPIYPFSPSPKRGGLIVPPVVKTSCDSLPKSLIGFPSEGLTDILARKSAYVRASPQEKQRCRHRLQNRHHRCRRKTRSDVQVIEKIGRGERI